MLEYRRSGTQPLLGGLKLDHPDNSIHLAPAGQLTSVHEIAERLFPAYTVDGGSIHLAGCWLEDRRFLRLGNPAAGYRYLDESGSPVDAGLVTRLGMQRTVPWVPPPEMPPDRLAKMVASSLALAERVGGNKGPLEVALIWCKYAEGKLRVTIGDQSADFHFAGWTAALEAPPFVCPHTGAASYHALATDDGRIVAAEKTARCARSGRRVLAEELVECDATGERVLPELTRICPVTERPVLTAVLVTCSLCCQEVSPRAVEAGICAACRSLRPIDGGEPPLDRLLAKHPGLKRWSKWKAAETAEVHVLLATRWWRRLLLVADKKTSAIRHAKLGNRLARLAPIPVDDLDALR